MLALKSQGFMKWRMKIYVGYLLYVCFCRFHPLSEFDEGKRSCRRRLAGHNRRRRKTQPEDVTSRLTIPGDGDNKTSGNLDIVNLLAAITRPQGNILMVDLLVLCLY